MGKKKKGNSGWEPNHPNITIIDLNSILEGDIHSSENIRINCDVIGNCITEGTVVISESASIQGDVSGQSIHVKGRVIGNLHSKGQIALTSNSHVEGDCICQSIVVDTGAFLKGRVAKSELNFIQYSKSNPEKELSLSVVTESNDVQLKNEDNNIIEEEDNPNRLW